MVHDFHQLGLVFLALREENFISAGIGQDSGRRTTYSSALNIYGIEWKKSFQCLKVIPFLCRSGKKVYVLILVPVVQWMIFSYSLSLLITGACSPFEEASL